MTSRRLSALVVFLLAIAVMLIAAILRGCQPSPQPIQPQAIGFRYYFPFVAKNYNPKLAAMHGVAASGNGGVAAVRLVGASWYLNWRVQPTPGMPSDVEFVPMINARTPSQVPPTSAVVKSARLAGINEPNVRAQGEICPKDYVDTWHEIEMRFDDRLLLSPGVGTFGNPDCISPNGEMRVSIGGADWLRDFREFYQQEYGAPPRWDALSFHCYPRPESPCDDFRAATEEMVALADKWGIAEVWVTEFDGGKYGAQSAQYVRMQVAYWLTVPKVIRIAYYQDWDYASPDNSPLTDKSGKLTEYGKAYRQ